MHTSSIHDKALHDLTLIKINGNRYVGRGSFLINILKRPQEVNISPTEDVPPLFLTKHYFYKTLFT